MKITKTTHMTATGRVTIPTVIRRHLGIYGTEADLLMEAEDSVLTVKPAVVRPRYPSALSDEVREVIDRLRREKGSQPFTVEELEALMAGRVPTPVRVPTPAEV